jgi:acetyltransferase-like isoleucine patch superfamily enzyme
MEGIEKGEIHRTSIVSDSARIGRGVTIGANVIVYDNVEVGENAIIGPGCYLGEPKMDYYKRSDYSNDPLIIGPNSLIRSDSILYAGSTIGENFECGHRVTVREGSKIGRHVRIGTFSDVQGYCRIGNYSRLHSSVFVSQESVIGEYVWIYQYVVLANDPHPPSNVVAGVTIDDFAVIASKATILPGVTVGRDALIGAMALVRSDVPSQAVMVGIPAKQVGDTRDMKSKYTQEPAYPWREHFERGMPWEGIGYAQWLSLRENVTNT